MKQIIKSIVVVVLSLTATTLNATKKSTEAQQLLDYLHSIYGKKTLSGAMACVNWNITEAKLIHDETGYWPAINTFDFLHDVWSSPGNWIDYGNPQVALDWANEGGIVSAMWHFGMPNNAGDNYTSNPGSDAETTSFLPSSVDAPESEAYAMLVSRIDQICEWLKPLRDAGIPVLWRPYHEAQGNWTEQNPGVSWHRAWFWWGIEGPEVFIRLWQFTYDRMVNHHGLNNLIWVFNYGDSHRWYPGDEYVDIVAYDSYNSSTADVVGFYQLGASEYPGKPVALSEIGNIGNISDIWEAGGRVLYFNPWYDYYVTGDTHAEQYMRLSMHGNFNTAQWKDAFSRDYVLSRDGFKADYAAFTSGIEEIGVAEPDNAHKKATYNLSGQMVDRSYKGIKIVGGRKVIR